MVLRLDWGIFMGFRLEEEREEHPLDILYRKRVGERERDKERKLIEMEGKDCFLDREFNL
jgi:hypothetical protein